MDSTAHTRALHYLREHDTCTSRISSAERDTLVIYCVISDRPFAVERAIQIFNLSVGISTCYEYVRKMKRHYS